MKLSTKVIMTVTAMVTTVACPAKTLSETLELSYKIDDLLEAEYKRQGFKPHEIFSLNLLGEPPRSLWAIKKQWGPNQNQS